MESPFRSLPPIFRFFPFPKWQKISPKKESWKPLKGAFSLHTPQKISLILFLDLFSFFPSVIFTGVVSISRKPFYSQELKINKKGPTFLHWVKPPGLRELHQVVVMWCILFLGHLSWWEKVSKKVLKIGKKTFFLDNDFPEFLCSAGFKDSFVFSFLFLKNLLSVVSLFGNMSRFLGFLGCCCNRKIELVLHLFSEWRITSLSLHLIFRSL